MVVYKYYASITATSLFFNYTNPSRCIAELRVHWLPLPATLVEEAVKAQALPVVRHLHIFFNGKCPWSRITPYILFRKIILLKHSWLSYMRGKASFLHFFFSVILSIRSNITPTIHPFIHPPPPHPPTPNPSIQMVTRKVFHPVMSSVLYFQSGLSSCPVHPEAWVECGYPEISQRECEARGCCYSNTTATCGQNKYDLWKKSKSNF